MEASTIIIILAIILPLLDFHSSRLFGQIAASGCLILFHVIIEYALEERSGVMSFSPPPPNPPCLVFIGQRKSIVVAIGWLVDDCSLEETELTPQLIIDKS